MRDSPKGAGVPYDPIGAIVLARMEDLGKTITQLAAEAKVPRVPVSFWLRGHRGLRSDRVARILTALNLAIVDAAQHQAAPPTDGEHGAAIIQTYLDQCGSLEAGAMVLEPELESSWATFCKHVGVDAGPRGVVGRLLRESYGGQVRFTTAHYRGSKKLRKVYLGISLKPIAPAASKTRRKQTASR